MPTRIPVHRSWRCSCGGVLDFEYHVVYRCRGCGFAHLIPLPAQPMELTVMVSADVAEFNEQIGDAIRGIKRMPDATLRGVYDRG